MSGILPTKMQLRDGLLARVDAYCALAGDNRSNVCKSALNDVSFLGRVERDANFTIDSYERLRAWLDQHWPEHKSARAIA